MINEIAWRHEMNVVGACGASWKNMEVLFNPTQDLKRENISVNSLVFDKKETLECGTVKEGFYNAPRKCEQNANWGRVIQKAYNTSGLKDAGQSVERSGANRFMCAFVETSTSMELFEKDRNVDRRNVEERTFATSGKVLDFTV